MDEQTPALYSDAVVVPQDVSIVGSVSRVEITLYGLGPAGRLGRECRTQVIVLEGAEMQAAMQVIWDDAPGGRRARIKFGLNAIRTIRTRLERRWGTPAY